MAITKQEGSPLPEGGSNEWIAEKTVSTLNTVPGIRDSIKLWRKGPLTVYTEHVEYNGKVAKNEDPQDIFIQSQRALGIYDELIKLTGNDPYGKSTVMRAYNEVKKRLKNEGKLPEKLENAPGLNEHISAIFQLSPYIDQLSRKAFVGEFGEPAK